MSNEKNTDDSRPDSLKSAFKDRLKALRHAQEYSQNGDVPKAVEKYTQYLGILAAYHKTDEKSLHPRIFDPEKDLTEMLLISHAYWDLAKAYDRSPRLQKECIRCLQQFISFSLGFKFQHVNAQMLKKFVKKRKAHNKKAFSSALDKLNVESKSCYIATHAYPNNEFKVLTTLRNFKRNIYSNYFGRLFVEIYYEYSPRLILFLEKRNKINFLLTTIIFKPVIYILAKLIEKTNYGHNKKVNN